MDIPPPGGDSPFELILRFRESAGLDEVAARNRETLMRGYESLIAGDVEGWWSIFDLDVVMDEAAGLPYGGTHRGLEAAKQANAGIFAAYDQSRAEIQEITAAGDMTIAWLRFTCRGTATGRTADFPIAELFRFRNGKVIEWRACYFDVTLAMDVCGVSGGGG